MNMKALPHSINDEIQNLMMDVFETLNASQNEELTIDDLLSTKKYYLEAMRLLNTTSYLSEGEIPTLLSALKLDIEEQVAEPSERLAYTLMLQKSNLEQATSQEDFNARFAIFAPLIIRYMDEVAA